MINMGPLFNSSKDYYEEFITLGLAVSRIKKSANNTFYTIPQTISSNT
jgi:hypothetical protein